MCNCRSQVLLHLATCFARKVVAQRIRIAGSGLHKSTFTNTSSAIEASTPSESSSSAGTDPFGKKGEERACTAGSYPPPATHRPPNIGR